MIQNFVFCFTYLGIDPKNNFSGFTHLGIDPKIIFSSFTCLGIGQKIIFSGFTYLGMSKKPFSGYCSFYFRIEPLLCLHWD
ncbi:hypothetical protein [Labilibaculum euxinus]